ncbi:hypothetical protein [Lentibacillus persicus]|uniref:hypothetical protein n=1 Tax=Lentibacillus persicus TaxID=640948 RepID=UPI001160B422|nr:hypothetical protein [Lentibacillus persicus]
MSRLLFKDVILARFDRHAIVLMLLSIDLTGMSIVLMLFSIDLIGTSIALMVQLINRVAT